MYALDVMEERCDNQLPESWPKLQPAGSLAHALQQALR